MLKRSDLTEEEMNDFGERAGMYEYDAHNSRELSEKLALQDIEERRKRRENRNSK